MDSIAAVLKDKINTQIPMNNQDDILSSDFQINALFSDTPVAPSPIPDESTPLNQLPEMVDTLSPQEIDHVKNLLYTIKDTTDSLLRFLSSHSRSTSPSPSAKVIGSPALNDGEVIEGVFSGEHMIGADGKEYPVPANYASKSKLVEGDMMKLTISPSGTFIYKQVGPIARKRIKGELLADPQLAQWSVLVDSRTYKILTASVTFHKGKAGDEVVILVPEDGESQWGAVENIIKK